MKTINRMLSVMLVAACMAMSVMGCAENSGITDDTEKQEAEDQTAVVHEKEIIQGSEEETYLFDPYINANEELKVLYLQGSWHDMGAQYASGAYDSMMRLYVSSMTSMLKNCGGDREKVDKAILEHMEHVKKECPDLYAFVEGVDEAVEEYDFVDAAVATVCGMAYVEGTSNENLSCENISAWGDATADGHLLAATNGDTLIDDEQQFSPTLVVIPDDGYKVISSSGASSNANMNDQGVITLGSGGQAAAEDDIFKDLTGSWMCVYALTKCKTADEALEMQQEGIFHYWLGNCHIADIHGNAYVYENTAAHSAVRKPGDFGEKDYLIANNHFLTNEMQSSLYNDDCISLVRK